MSTMTIVGVLDAETVRYDDINGQGTPPVTLARPTATPLRNDGIFHHWLARGEKYTLAWDGTGWHVTCDTWRGGHVYRLAEAADAQFVGALPVEGAPFELERGKTYEIHEAEPSRWGLYVL